MFYYHWLIKLFQSIAEQYIARLEETESRQSQGDAMSLLKETDTRSLPVSHRQPHADTRINRDGLI